MPSPLSPEPRPRTSLRPPLGKTLRRVALTILFCSCPVPSGVLAAVLSGTVTDPMGSGVGDVDLDVFNPQTGEELLPANDRTSSDGTFSLAIPAGTYDLVLTAPIGIRLVAKRVLGVSVSEPGTEMGVLPLDPGALVRGTLLRSLGGAPIPNAKTEAVGSESGVPILTPNASSDTNGDFSAIVPLGRVDLTLSPPSADRLLSRRLLGLQVDGDLELGTISFNPGFLVTGTVRSGALGIRGVALNFFAPTSGAEIPTPAQSTGSDGSYSVVLPPGSFIAKASPPFSSNAARTLLTDVLVAGDRNLDIQLTATSTNVRIAMAGRVIPSGSNFRPEVHLQHNTPTSETVLIRVQIRFLPRGLEHDVVPPILRRLENLLFLRGRAKIPIPSSIPGAFRDVPLQFAVSVFDSSGSNLIDSDFVEFRAR